MASLQSDSVIYVLIIIADAKHFFVYSRIPRGFFFVVTRSAPWFRISAMRDGLILSAIGKDHPGIVDRLTGLIFEKGGNVEDSRMAILGGEFTLMILVTGPAESLTSVEKELNDAAEELELTVQCRRTHVGNEGGEDAHESRLSYCLNIVSMDHPGIVHRVTNLLAQQGVNVATLDTHLGHAPTTGTPVFSLNMEIQAPTQISFEELQKRLELLAEAENLDLELREQDGSLA